MIKTTSWAVAILKRDTQLQLWSDGGSCGAQLKTKNDRVSIPKHSRASARA